jgi:hypothetical protein
VDVISGEIVDAVQRLGTTPDAIATALWSKGVTGRPCRSGKCVIAAFLGAEFPEAEWVRVKYNPFTQTVRIDADVCGIRSTTFYEGGLATFLHKFDDGMFRELITPNT